MVTSERTQCLPSPKNTTAFTAPISKSTSSKPRRRTKIISPASGGRMTLSTFIYISLAVITLTLSPSAYAERCSPVFMDMNGGVDDDGSAVILNNSDDEDFKTFKQTEVVVREGASFKMSCELSLFHSVKWTINNREVTPQMQDDWDMNIYTSNVMDGFIFTELLVNNASTKFHPGEYKCTSVCLYDSPGANLGVKVTVSIAINVTVNSEATAPDFLGYRVYKKFVAREKRIELICTAHVPDASMNWYRVLDNREEEDMKLQVCIGPDVELTDRKKPPEHCKVTYDVGRNTTVLRLEIKRVRKEGNETLKTISDFRKYVCRVGKNGQQDEKGGVVVELVERVSATRSFGHRGLQSLTVVQGEELKIYCDIHGVDPKDFKNGNTKVVWMKDGQVLNIEETPDNDIKKFERVEKDEKGSPYRVGFSYLLADTEHRGNYRCDVIKEGERNQDPDNQNAGDGFATLTYYVRVKDKLGALWPFLGICGEVVILCTIILIYEKRRSKAELEESDTDGSPDQNNSNSND